MIFQGGGSGPPVPPFGSALVCFHQPFVSFQYLSIIPPLRANQLQMELRRNRGRKQALIVALAVFDQQQARHGADSLGEAVAT